MLNIDIDIFKANLELTQAYCELQLSKHEKDHAKILRSFNSIGNGTSLFSFGTSTLDYDDNQNETKWSFAEWLIDPIASDTSIEYLFADQLDFKKKLISNVPAYYPLSGKIIISLFDETVVDGASEVASKGLFDVFDLPPIDTWFYITRAAEGRLLFAWIPNELYHYANEAILVNCMDMINWFEDLYSEDYHQIFS